jgi:hypothetical protein
MKNSQQEESIKLNLTIVLIKLYIFKYILTDINKYKIVIVKHTNFTISLKYNLSLHVIYTNKKFSVQLNEF